MIAIILFIVWWLIGATSFVYWYRHDHDVDMPALLVAFFAGLIGPFSFLVGWMIHGKLSNKVIFPRKR